MTQLYILANEFKDAADTLSNLDLDAQTIADTIEGLSGELEQKAVATAMVARNMAGLAAQIKEAESAMYARRKSLEARSEYLVKYIHDCMSHAGVQSIESPHFALKIKKNPALVVIDCPDLIPSEYMKIPEPQPPTIDKVAIKEALKDGKEIPGAHLQQLTRLDIK
jgi:hypothetical protein